ncbi:MAG TPA: branched-chain amino acid ABC transporter permease [Stellaceae bacterium]|nr:branched-chain amino acid ABC transporter permease [Stellaceae bacterium]
MSATEATPTAAARVVDAFARRHRLAWGELVPWAVAVAAYFLFPDYLALGSQVLATILFGLSLDLILGYAGIVTLGHAALFGAGAYTAGLLAAHGWGEPLSGLVIAAAVAGLVGLVSGAIVLRTQGLTLLMVTLVVASMLYEAANKAAAITGGADGLSGMNVLPVLGFSFDLYGQTAYWYCLSVLFLCWVIARGIVHSPFGRSLTGIRENERRMHAIGSPVYWRRLTIYSIAAAMAGASGALIAQTTGFVGLDSLDPINRSGAILIMLILGGVGRLYGAFIGVPLYMILQDRFAAIDPVYWYFYIGLVLVLVVVFAPGGAFGLADRLLRRVRRSA